MVLTAYRIKLILIVLNSVNIFDAILNTMITWISLDNHQQNNVSGTMNYITMIMSAVCCSGTVMESSCILQISANMFLSKVVVTIVLWIYRISPAISFYNFFNTLLHSVILCIAYYFTQMTQMIKLNRLIATYTGVAAIPLNPPPQVRSDVI